MKNDFLSKLYSRRGYIKLGLDRIKKAFLQIKTKEFPVYHIAGTNGKGTVVYAVDHLLRNNSMSVGRFISPHIVDYNERIAVNGKNITDEELKEIYNFLEKSVDNFDELSFFEITFLIAWKFFELKNVDRAVFEVGLGGRLDATNVIDYPKTDFLVSIGLEHTRVLGDTVEEIASEKLGIVHKKDSLFLGNIDEALLEHICFEATGKGVERIVRFFHSDDLVFPKNSCFSKEQKANLELAFNAVSVVEKITPVFDFQNFEIPGRFQYFKKDIIFDVAHNPPAIFSLVNHLKKLNKNPVVIFGAMRDKDIKSILNYLSEISDTIFLIHLDNASQRGETVENMLQKASLEIKNRLKFEKNSKETIRKALKIAKEHQKQIVVTGSFFMIEKFLEIYREINNEN